MCFFLITVSDTHIYYSLCRYAEQEKNTNPHGWDGHVHANYKTSTNPPLNLGRWVNKQQCAHAKGRLKEEYVTKLEATGLKWLDEEDFPISGNNDDDYYVGIEFRPEAVKSVPSLPPLPQQGTL